MGDRNGRLRFLRRGRPRGQIHLRFGEGLTVTDLVDPAELEAGVDGLRKQALVATLAFEVAVRMNAATPITATAIITLILLAAGNRAQSLVEIQTLARAGAALIRRRQLEIVGRSNFQDADTVRVTLAELQATGIVSYLDEGTERLYTIGPDQHLNAAYYRNTAIHYFILDAFVEIALLDSAGENDPAGAFFTRTSELRELFKFEFYFPRRAEYRPEIEKLANERFGGWEDIVRRDEAGVRDALHDVPLLVAHGVLRSFVDAYRVVANVLAEASADVMDDESDFLSRCLKTGKQQLLQGRVFSAESISKSLYATGLTLASAPLIAGLGLLVKIWSIIVVPVAFWREPTWRKRSVSTASVFWRISRAAGRKKNSGRTWQSAARKRCPDSPLLPSSA